MDLKEKLFRSDQNFERNYKGNFYSDLLEQYKLYVDMADKVSTRRDAINSFFLVLQSLLVGGIGFCLKELDEKNFLPIILSLFGLMFCHKWYKIIKAYRQLNAAKFKIIHMMETKLPARGYDAEWDALERGKNPKLYTPLSHIEESIPKTFGVAYFILLIISLKPYILKMIEEISKYFIDK